MNKLFVSIGSLLLFAAAHAQFNGALVIGPQGATVSPAFTVLPDTAARTSTAKGGIRIGIITNIPLSNRFYLHTGIIYSAKGAKEQQVFDEATSGLRTAITQLNVNYIDAPVNLLYKQPLKGKTNILLGAGPQLSLFYTGSLIHSTIDAEGKFTEDKNEDLPVGKGDGQYRTLHLGANAFGGLEFGRVFITANYSSGLGAFYQKENKAFKQTTWGATLGLYLGKRQVAEQPAVTDGDGDGVPDNEDACPTLAGSALTNGCPDSDSDGVPDGKDSCATVAGLVKYNGCPIPDKDKDGINDEQDRCPTLAGLAKYGGCPMPDKDGDGIADEEDACPTTAGPAANKGCPEVSKEVVEKVAYAARKLEFDFQKASIKTTSYALLDEVVEILKAHPQVKLNVEGHTAGTPNEANLQLSQQRAQNVKAYIVAKGIAAERVTAVGYGASRPLVKTTDPVKGAVNRRVELKLSE